MFAPAIKFEKEFWFFLLQYEVVHCCLQISFLFLSICDQWEDKGIVANGVSQIQEKGHGFSFGNVHLLSIWYLCLLSYVSLKKIVFILGLNSSREEFHICDSGLFFYSCDDGMYKKGWCKNC